MPGWPAFSCAAGAVHNASAGECPCHNLAMTCSAGKAGRADSRPSWCMGGKCCCLVTGSILKGESKEMLQDAAGDKRQTHVSKVPGTPMASQAPALTLDQSPATQECCCCTYEAVTGAVGRANVALPAQRRFNVCLTRRSVAGPRPWEFLQAGGHHHRHQRVLCRLLSWCWISQRSNKYLMLRQLARRAVCAPAPMGATRCAFSTKLEVSWTWGWAGLRLGRCK